MLNMHKRNIGPQSAQHMVVVFVFKNSVRFWSVF